MRTLFGLWVICYSTLLFANAQPNDEKLVSALIEQGIICEGLSVHGLSSSYKIRLADAGLTMSSFRLMS